MHRSYTLCVQIPPPPLPSCVSSVILSMPQFTHLLKDYPKNICLCWRINKRKYVLCLAHRRSTAYFNSLLLRDQMWPIRPNFPLIVLAAGPKLWDNSITSIFTDEKAHDDLPKILSSEWRTYLGQKLNVCTYIYMYVCIYAYMSKLGEK